MIWESSSLGSVYIGHRSSRSAWAGEPISCEYAFAGQNMYRCNNPQKFINLDNYFNIYVHNDTTIKYKNNWK